MNSDLYAETGASVCPACRSENISAGDCNHEAPATQEVECKDCGATWNDIYKLVGYEDLKTG